MSYRVQIMKVTNASDGFPCVTKTMFAVSERMADDLCVVTCDQCQDCSAQAAMQEVQMACE